MEGGSQKSNELNFCLPDHLVSKIFQLLPFESILACKRVSKQWYNLINHPNFSNLYHHNGSMILLLNIVGLHCLLTRHSNEITRLPSYTVHRIPIWFNNGSKHELLSGWSNGIACAKESNGYFLLYNWFTGASHTVKDAPLRLYSESWIYYGFGYDRYDDDHKIMVVCDSKAKDWLDLDKVQNKENSLFWVYSYRNRRWKSFDGFPYAAYSWRSFSESDGKPYSFNGVLHYAVVKDKLVRDGVATGKWVIVTYDLHTRRFEEILLRNDHILCCRVVNVTELDGQLCCAYDRCVFGKVYGVGGSWTKLLSIACYSSLCGLAYKALYEFGVNRKVGLFVCHGRLLWYDFTNNELQEVDAFITWLKRRQRQQQQEMKLGQQMRKRFNFLFN